MSFDSLRSKSQVVKKEHKNMKFFILLSLISLISADTSVTINFSRSINDISEKYISHKIDFYELVKYRSNLALVTPSYLKLSNFLEYLRHFEQNESGISSIFQTFYRNRITPVIVIDYNITNFEPVTLLKDLKRAKDLNIKECVWQLGENNIEYNYGNFKKYTEDLKTLNILCESVRNDSNFNWKVASVSTFLDDKITFDVDGYDFGSFTRDEIVTKSPIKSKTSRNVWITISNNSNEAGMATTQQNGKHPESCDETCLINGLSYAQVLGESAKKGIDVVFFESQDISSINANVFKQAIDKMHNSLIGTRVFKVRSSKSSYDKTQPSVYAYCSKKMNGGVTLMGINYSNSREKINSMLSTSLDFNSIVLQYILSIADGHVMVNNEKYNGTITPAYKFKKNTKFSIDFTIPPFSIAFWVVKNANEKECFNRLKNEEGNKVRTRNTITSSTDDLLKTLAANALKKENEKLLRSKRQINNMSPLLPKFDLNFANIVPSNVNQRSIKDVFFNKNTEIYKVAPIEPNPLQSSENPALPNGDVYLLIDDGVSHDYVNAEMEYPVMNAKDQKSLQKSNRKNVKVEMPNEFLASYDYFENTYKTSKKSSKKKPSNQPQKNVGELFEIEQMHADYSNNYDHVKSPNTNVEIKTIRRELEPTYRQSKKAMLAAKRKWNQNQLMEFLKDATLQEVDKSQIHDANEFQIIDLSNDEEVPLDYEDYEDNDEDGFFNNDKHKIRTRRSIDWRKNEIPRFDNFFGDSEEDKDSKSVEDAHLFLPPRYHNDKAHESTSSTTQSTITIDENSPFGLKFIDVFSKSLDDIVFTVHKNLVTWWYFFSPPSYS